MFTALRSMFRDPEGKVILVWATAQSLLGTLVYRRLEGWSLVDALYFSVVTLATVGFGDLHPTTVAAKLLTVLYILYVLFGTRSSASPRTRWRPGSTQGSMLAPRARRP